MLFTGILCLFSGIYLEYGTAIALMATGGIITGFSISMIFFESIAAKRG